MKYFYGQSPDGRGLIGAHTKDPSEQLRALSVISWMTGEGGTVRFSETGWTITPLASDVRPVAAVERLEQANGGNVHYAGVITDEMIVGIGGAHFASAVLRD